MVQQGSPIRRKNSNGGPGRKEKHFLKREKYVRRNDTPSKKKKGCTCYICDEGGHFAP